MSDDRCFCGAAWVDEREECAAGHGFGEADKFRVRAEKAEARTTALESASRKLLDALAEAPDDGAEWDARTALAVSDATDGVRYLLSNGTDTKETKT